MRNIAASAAIFIAMMHGIVFGQKSDGSAQFTRFHNSSAAGNAVVCATDGNVQQTSNVESLAQCTDACRGLVTCTGFNLKSQQTQSTSFLCQLLYGCPAVNFTTVAGCTYYQVTRTSKQSAADFLRDCLLIQQHYTGTRTFDKTWAEFKVGFGNLAGDYWMGNDRLHELTKDGRYKLRVDLQFASDGLWLWAEYSTFIVDDESTGYKLHVSGFSGNVDDSVTIGCPSGIGCLDRMKFTTRDRDNDFFSSNCANFVGNIGGFWFNGCSYILVNNVDGTVGGFSWFKGGAVTNLRTSRMTLILK